jgi:hypothetical protein
MMDCLTNVEGRKVEQSTFRRWHDLLTRRVRRLGKADTMSIEEVKLRLSHLLDLVGIGWSVLKDSRRQSSVCVPSAFGSAGVLPDQPLDDLARSISKIAFAPLERSDGVPSAKEAREVKKAREDGSLWWQKKDRLAMFAGHARRILRKVSETKKKPPRGYVAALSKLTGTPVSRLRSRKLGSFAEKVLVALGREPDLKKVEEVYGGLSVLLADLEAKLGVYPSCRS